jgi:hypothetical protein
VWDASIAGLTSGGRPEGWGVPTVCTASLMLLDPPCSMYQPDAAVATLNIRASTPCRVERHVSSPEELEAFVIWTIKTGETPGRLNLECVLLVLPVASVGTWGRSCLTPETEPVALLLTHGCADKAGAS